MGKEKIKKEKKMRKEKPTFYLMSVSIDNEGDAVGKPTNHTFKARTSSAAARKAVNAVGKETGKTEDIIVHMREAGVKDRVRKYAGKIVPDIHIEPNTDGKVLLQKGLWKIEDLTAEQLKERNVWYAEHKLNTINDKPWTEEDAKARNAKLIDGHLVLQPGKHCVIRQKQAKTKFLEVIKFKEGKLTLHEDDGAAQTEKPAASAPKEPKVAKPKGRKAKSGAAPAPKVEATPAPKTEATVAPVSPAPQVAPIPTPEAAPKAAPQVVTTLTPEVKPTA